MLKACSITVQILSPPHATESVYKVRMLVLMRGRGRGRTRECGQSRREEGGEGKRNRPKTEV